MRRAILGVAIILAATNALADEPTETTCFVLATGADGKVHKIADGTKVLELTRAPTAFSIVIPQGYRGASVWCERSDLVPAENDWKVIRGGYPIYLSDNQTGQILVLELDKGQVKTETVSGPMPTPDQFNALQKRLDQLQISLDAADRAKSPEK